MDLKNIIEKWWHHYNVLAKIDNDYPPFNRYMCAVASFGLDLPVRWDKLECELIIIGWMPLFKIPVSHIGCLYFNIQVTATNWHINFIIRRKKVRLGQIKLLTPGRWYCEASALPKGHPSKMMPLSFKWLP